MEITLFDMQVAPMEVLQAALHAVSQVVLYPVIVTLLAMIAYALFSVGSVLVELLRERRHFRVVIPHFLRTLQELPADQIPGAVAESGMLRGQKLALLVIFNNRDLDEESLWALAKKQLLQEQERRQKVVSRNDAMSKLAPMVGLMGTLIPLGPGIVAFSQGDGSAMASAMLVAFDTTVAGLLTAAVMFVIARIRRRWYASYHSSLEAAVTTLLDRIEHMTEEERHVQHPTEGEALPQPESEQQDGQPSPQSAHVQTPPFEADASQPTQDVLFASAPQAGDRDE